MLLLDDMLLRLLAAVVFGAVVGIERELAGKEAGFRTDIMVAAGAAIFSIVSISLPYLLALSPENLAEMLARNGGFLGALSNVVVGVGFLGAGIIIRQGVHVYGLTTAATIWFVAAIGVLCGIGLWEFAGIAAVGLSALLFILRELNIPRFGRRGNEDHA
jgi:putative Mg2+ transporter-C (MgtC) family protein